MARLIDADALLKKQFVHVCKGRQHPPTVHTSEIMLAPTIDAVEVVYARWTGSPRVCSACENYQPTDDWDDYIDYPWCPHCGARMDAEEGYDGRKTPTVGREHTPAGG